MDEVNGFLGNAICGFRESLEGMVWWKWVVAALVALVVFGFILHFINRAFRIRYDLNLFGGGLLVIIAAASAGGALLLTGDGVKLGYILYLVAAAAIIFTLVYNCKKCGFGMGVVAFLCQILFAPGSLVLLLDFLNPNTAYYSYALGDDERIRKIRRRKRHDDRYDDYYR